MTKFFSDFFMKSCKLSAFCVILHINNSNFIEKIVDMIYPNNFEAKIGFTEIRRKLQGNCLCTLGWELVNEMGFMSVPEDIRRSFAQLRELRRLKENEEELPLQYIYDIRSSIVRLKLKGTHLEEQELFDLLRNLQTVHGIRNCLNGNKGNGLGDDIDNKGVEHEESEEQVNEYPALWQIVKDVNSYPNITRRISSVLDKFGHIKDSASSVLFHIRMEQKKMVGSVSHTLNSILRSAQAEGFVDKDITPTMRDGRLVIPVAPAMKRKIQGIVHDESASGKTLFIEPTAVVEANNRIRELEAEERREVIRILTELSEEIRPHIDGVLEVLHFLGIIDFLQAKSQLAEQFNAIEPQVIDKPCVDWVQAVHPLLKETLDKQGREIVPLDVTLKGNKSKGEILVISGPNAGGKSVCLKTVGLLQYMAQCGVSVPLKENSTMGVFGNIMIDIGDDQNMDDDLSTYSSHLTNMKMMIKNADAATLLLIDEFGTGTEPQIGGAIAEAVLGQFWKKGAWGIITTHYQNLKHFAEGHPGVTNGAMLYDRHEMKALFRLEIGRPGSSFAIEIARKIGLPDEVIREASDIVGQDYIQSDKYLQDIVRDKRYWEQKRQTVHQREKDIERTITRFESSVEEIESERKAILRRAKVQAEELLREANRRIENTIREIREAEAEKAVTRRLREEMAEFREEVSDIDASAKDAAIEKKMQQILARREREAKRKEERQQKKQQPVMLQNAETATDAKRVSGDEVIETVCEGNYVKIKGTKSGGYIESVQGKYAVVVIGDMRTKMPLKKLERAEEYKEDNRTTMLRVPESSRMTRNVIDEHRNGFSQEIDVRGMRGDEALLSVQRFVDDAILIGVSRVRILHGKGNGILRMLVRQYLEALPNVISCKDEHVQFGGAGITVVELG